MMQRDSASSNPTAAFAAVASLTALGKIPFFVPVAYLLASGVTFLAYGIDKSAAMNRRWRTQESTLHFLGMAGGWPGALAAQRMFRHKSSKPEFRNVFWLTVVLNCGALAWCATGFNTSFLMAHTIVPGMAVA